MNVTAPVIDVPASGTYHVDPEHSEITFRTRHMFGLGKVVGTFGIAAGEIVVAEPLVDSTVFAEAGAASFATDNAKRDDQVRSKKFLDVERYPTIMFRSNQLVEESGTWVLHGVLTVRGNDAPLALEITRSEASGDGLVLQAVGSVDRFDHGITAMRGMAGRHLELTVSVHTTKS
jgi:polyisoprenoid-binding protein YceI